jgi:hypothetical protein
MNFVNTGTLEPATVENVTAAVLRLSLLDESQIHELAATGALTARFPYCLSDTMPVDELRSIQLARIAAPARALTKEERDRVEAGRPASAPLRNAVVSLIRKLKARSDSGSSSM